MVSVVFDNIAAGVDRSEIPASHPALTPPDIESALRYAAEPARESTADLPLELGA